MPFLTSLATGLANVVGGQTDQLRRKQMMAEQERVLAERQQRQFQQQKDLAEMKQKVLGSAAGATPEFLEALAAGDFDRLPALIASNPENMKAFRAVTSIVGPQAQEHAREKAAPGRLARIESESKAKQDAITSARVERQALGLGVKPKGAGRGGAGKASTTDKKEQAALLKALKSRYKQLDNELKTIPKVKVPNPDAGLFSSAPKFLLVESERAKQIREMLTEVNDQIAEIEQAPLRAPSLALQVGQAAPMERPAPAPPSTGQKPKLMPAQPKVSKNAAAILKMFQEFE